MVLNLNWRIRNAESFASLLDVDFEGRPLDLPLLDVARMAVGSDRGLYQRQSTPINWLVGFMGTLLHRLHRWCAPWLYNADSVLDFLDGEEWCRVRNCTALKRRHIDDRRKIVASDLTDERRRNRLLLFLQMAHREYLDEGTPPPSWDDLVARASQYGARCGFAPHTFEELGDQTLRDVLDA